MNLTLDSGKLLYAIGVALAIAALAYFMSDLVFGLSITVKAALLFLCFLAFLTVGTATERDVLDLVALAIAGGSYLVFVLYVMDNYRPDEAGTFLILASSAALFLGLGYLLREREFTLPVRTAGYVVAAFALVGVVLVGADAAMGDVSYELETADDVTVERPTELYENERVPSAQVHIGTITVSNPSVFRQPVDPPRPSACTVDEDGVVESHQYVNLESPGEEYGYVDSIGGGQSAPIHLYTDLQRDANQTEAITYAVQRGEGCSTDADRPTVVITFDDADSPRLAGVPQ